MAFDNSLDGDRRGRARRANLAHLLSSSATYIPSFFLQTEGPISPAARKPHLEENVADPSIVDDEFLVQHHSRPEQVPAL
jgi:hypothetical protein